MISQSEAHAALVQGMRSPHPNKISGYGYDLYLPTLISHHLGNPPYHVLDPYARDNFRAFANAAWDLCRRGILRPSVSEYGGTGNDDGKGFTITAHGRTWLAEAGKGEFLTIAPGQLAQKLAAYRARFGDAYHQRAQEAANTYLGAHYLACCSMAGAAAESILLTVACAKSDTANVFALSRSAGGRRKVEKLVLGSAPQEIRDQALAQLDVMKYWRDDASHGMLSPISEPEAFTALILVLRLAILMNDHWAELTGLPA